MTRSRKASSTNAIASVLIVLGILVVVNYISARRFVRADLTENKEFTISQSSRNVLGRLDDVVNIRVYFTSTKKLPSRLVSLGQQVRDLMDEYRAYSGGNLDVRFIDPEDDPEEQQAARALGIQQVPLQVIEKDKMSVLNAYLGIAVLYGGKKEVIPQVLNVRNLEYDLTSRILKVTQSEQKTVGFLSGHGERSLETDLTGIRGALGEQYRMQAVQGGGPIPEEIATLVVAQPKNVPERDKYEIDQFIMRGGKAIFLVDVLELMEGMLQARVVESGLEDLLAHYGVRVRKELVLDQVSSNATFNMGFMTVSLPYPFWPKVLKPGLDEDSPVVAELSSLVLPWTAPTEVKGFPADGEGEAALDTSGVETIVLAASSPASWVQRGPFNLNPQQRFLNLEGEEKQYPVAVALSGRLPSFYAGKDVPPPEGEEDESPPPLTSSPETQIVVVGSSAFILDDFLPQFPSGGIFFLNTVDWLTMGEDLIGIRSRGLTDRPLKDVTEGVKSTVKFVNVFAIPILVIVYGLIRVYARRRARKVHEAYGA